MEKVNEKANQEKNALLDDAIKKLKSSLVKDLL